VARALRLVVATRLLEAVEQEIAAAFDARFEPAARPADAVARAGGAADALLVSLDTPLPGEQIDALPASVRAIATYSVGTDHVDCEAAARRGIAVFNTPGVLSDSVAENAILLMLGAARRATESIELIRSGRWQGWSPRQLVGVELAGRQRAIRRER